MTKRGGTQRGAVGLSRYLWGVYETLCFPGRHPVLRLEEKEEEEMIRLILLPLSLLKSNYYSGLLP